MKFFADVSTTTMRVCASLENHSDEDRKNLNAILCGAFIAQVALVIFNVAKRPDFIGEYEGGTESALHVYELLLKSNPKDRERSLDDLLQRRDNGTLENFVKERSLAACKN